MAKNIGPTLVTKATEATLKHESSKASAEAYRQAAIIHEESAIKAKLQADAIAQAIAILRKAEVIPDAG